MIRKVVPADNKCLFTAVGYAVEKRMDMAKELRYAAASIIMSDPEKYNEVYLGMPNTEYVQKLSDDNTWGSAQEVAILGEYLGIEIAVVLIQTGEVQRFGQDKSFTERIFLLYDGVHYDAVVWSDSGVSEYDFP